MHEYTSSWDAANLCCQAYTAGDTLADHFDTDGSAVVYTAQSADSADMPTEAGTSTIYYSAQSQLSQAIQNGDDAQAAATAWKTRQKYSQWSSKVHRGVLLA